MTPIRLILISFLFIACTPKDNVPSDMLSQLHVPDGYEVSLAAGPDLLAYPMFATLDHMGRLFVFESTGNVYETSQEAIDTPQFRIRLLRDLDGDGIYDTATTFADSLSFPQGGVFYEGSLIASSAPDLLKLTDTDGDDVADEREVIMSGWTLNVNANSLIGPFMGPDGWLYMTNAIMGFDVQSLEGERMKGETARIWRLRPDGSKLEWISAGGMNNPVELAFTSASEVLGTQTFFIRPQRGLRDAITYWTEGGIYGKKNDNITRDQLPLTGELLPVIGQYSRVAPSGLGMYRNTVLGQNFQHNLFSTQFNTHKVVRHQLIREGASFRMEDEDFLWTDHEDFHPTDVLEDADGSLLVVETGGWFILGCPLSQVSKPQLKGHIYRIRRTKAPTVEDAFGKMIPWESLSSPAVAQLLEDTRPFVRDRAVEELVKKGQEAVSAVWEVVATSSSTESRVSATFCLYRIGSSEAFSYLRKALSNEHEEVRIAAARSLGLARDLQAVDALVAHLADPSLAVRRQTATALGQIGDPQSSVALMEAAASSKDRYLEHAITYSLIQLGQTATLQQGLLHSSLNVRKVALIALDQLPGAPLRFTQLRPFLIHPDPKLQQTAQWVASHHPDWAGEMASFLSQKLNQGEFSTKEKGLLGDLLIAFCGNPAMQSFIADKFSTGNPVIQQFMLKTMSDCEAETFPEKWIHVLKPKLTQGSNQEIRSSIVDVIRLRSLKALSNPLSILVDQPESPLPLKIKSIAALVSLTGELSDAHFALLLEQMISSEEIPLQQQCADVIGSGERSETQLSQLVTRFLPQADPFLLPRLIPAFAGSQELTTGQALAAALLETPSLGNFTAEQIRTTFSNYPSDIQSQVEQLIQKLNTDRAGRLARLQDLQAMIETGDEARGRELYFGKAICWTCHTMGDQGGSLGPDLTSIQKDRSAHDILEAVLYPSVSFVREYETYEVKTADNTYTGVIHEQSPEALVLGIGPDASLRLMRSEITDITPQNESMMPLGLGELLSDKEIADLMAFLMGNDLIYW